MIDKSYRAIKDYGVGEFFKRLFIFFDRKFRPAKYYHILKAGAGSESSEKHILFVSGEPKNATSYYRCEIPAKQLKLEDWQVDIVSEEFIGGIDISNYNLIVFYRTPLKAVSEMLSAAQSKGIKTLFSVDDFIYRRDLIEKLDYLKNLYPDDASRLLDRSDGMLKLMKRVDAGVASTDHLAADMKKIIKGEVFVNRNGIDEKFMNVKQEKDISKSKIIMGYFSGSETHDRDFEMIWPAVKKILRNNNNAELWLGGRIDTADYRQDEVGVNIKQLPFMKRENYMKTLGKIDIKLFPLENTEFNGGKSEIKFLEAGLMETPSVVSPVGDMRSVIKDGETGMLADSLEEWEKKLNQLIENNKLRIKLGKNAREYILENYNLEKLGKELDQFLSGFRNS